ncbi:MAG: hypothetical protein QM667_12295 [Asticcacaulis sp.]
MKAVAAGWILAALLALPVQAQEAMVAPDDVYDTGVRPTGDDCLKSGNIEVVDLSVLLEAHEVYKGRCVIVAGYYRSRALFLSWLAARRKFAGTSGDLQGQRMGLYGRDPIMEGLHRLPEGRYVRLTGKVWDCDSMRTPRTLMLMGYCHYTSGPILSVVAFEAPNGNRTEDRAGQDKDF